MTRYIHVVWSAATGPIAAYTNPELAWTHARSMLGVEVTSLPISPQLPAIVLDDLEEDFESAQDTPAAVTVEEIDGD